MKKRLIAILMIAIVMGTLVENVFATNVEASEYIKDNAEEVRQRVEKDFGMTENNAFNNDDYIYTSKKVKEEKNRTTGIIDVNKEKKLNECGVLDEEIFSLDKKDIELIQSTDVEDLVVITNIYAYEDVKDTNSDLVELTAEQIDKLYGHEYYGEINDLEIELQEIYNEQKGIVEEGAQLSADVVDRDITKSSILSATNAGELVKSAASVTALSKTTSSYSDSAQSSYLKKTIYAVSNKSNKTITVTYNTTWITMPEYRCVDNVVIYWTGMVRNAKACTVTHKVFEKCKTTVLQYKNRYGDGDCSLKYQEETNKWVSNSVEYNSRLSQMSDLQVTSDVYDMDSESVSIFIVLHQDGRKITWDSTGFIKTIKECYYTNEQVTANFTLNDIEDGILNRIYCKCFHYYFMIRTEYDYLGMKSGVFKIKDGVKKAYSEFNLIGGMVEMFIGTDKIVLSIKTKTDIGCTESGVSFGPILMFKYK